MKLFIRNTLCESLLALCLFCTPACLTADAIVATSIAPGYQATSIELGQPFGGAIAQHPSNSNLLYVSYGNYAFHRVLELQLDTGTTRTVTPFLGNVGGLAVLDNGDLAITENDDFSSDTILRARDLTGDGAFFDEGEITELIAPILTAGGNFTGAQMAVAPAGSAADIPAGSLIIQTADGGANSELLVVESPENSPVFRPVGGAFYSGFTYNGGVAFTAAGNVLCGISEFPTGKVNALVNSNGDTDIDPNEVHTIVDGTVLTDSISDLSATGDDKLITCGNSRVIRMFELPADLLADTATSGTNNGILAVTNATYVSTVRVDFPSRGFSSAVAGPRATIYLGGYVSFPAATNLLGISPLAPAGVEDWYLFN